MATLRFLQSPFLTSFDREAFMNSLAPSRHVPAGRLLAKEGDALSDVFVLLDGWACRCTTNSKGIRHISAIIMTGNFCNLDTMVSQRITYDIRALTATTFASIPREKLDKLSTLHNGIAKTISWLTLADNAILSQRTTSLGRRSAKERISHLLCEFAFRLNRVNRNKALFELPLTQDHLADVLGLTAVHVNRTIRTLREEGLVGFNRHLVALHDVEALQHICEFDPTYLQAGFLN